MLDLLHGRLMRLDLQTLLVQIVAEHSERSAAEEKVDLLERLLLRFFEPDEDGRDGDDDVWWIC